MHLLTRLSTFLPPPLAHIIDPRSPSTQRQGQLPHNLDLLKFWNSNVNAYPMNGMGMGGGDRWWSIEELGEGASVLRSKTGVHGNGVDREVWVLRVGSEGHDGSESDLLPSHSCRIWRSARTSLTIRSSTAPQRTHPLPPPPRSTSSRTLLSQSSIPIPHPTAARASTSSNLP